MAAHKAPHTMKRKSDHESKIKNYAPESPEGPSSQADSAMCNAGPPHCTTGFLIPASTGHGKYEEKEKRRKERIPKFRGLGRD